MTHVPNKTVVIRPRDKPWMKSEVRRAVRKINSLLKSFVQVRILRTGNYIGDKGIIQQL
jgi:hypothetical protein